MRRQFWTAKLVSYSQKYGFENGYKFLFVPWDTLNDRDTVFLANMPYFTDKLPADNVDLRMISPDIERYEGFVNDIFDPPVIQQFNKLAQLIGKIPTNILTGAATPFRANNWSDFSAEQQNHTIYIGKRFWKEALQLAPINLIITSGEIARDIVLQQFDVLTALEMSSGWDDLKLIRYETSLSTTIISLPDLAEYELLSKDECIDPLRQVFRNCFF